MARRKDRPGPLEPRSEAILRAIIEEYVATAQPVGSQALVAKYRLGVSPATVRNVMAELERPATCAPAHQRRPPADRQGYRLYVESIADAVVAGAGRAAHDPPPVRPGGVRQRAVVPPGGRHARRRHARGGHRHAGQADAVAPPPRRPRGRTATAWRAWWSCSRRAPSSRCCCRSMRAPTRPTSTTSRAASTSAWPAWPRRTMTAGRPGAAARRRDGPPDAPASASASQRAMRDFDAAAVEDVFSEGLLNVMDAPEFARSEKLRRVFACSRTGSTWATSCPS